MRVLVTGGAGYIGSFSTRALQAAGHDVVVYDNLCYGHPEAIDAELVIGDLADTTQLDACLGGGHFDAVVHFAAFVEAGESMCDAARFFQNNVGNSINLLNALSRHEIAQIIFSSTAGVYAQPAETPISEFAPLGPLNVYAATKHLVEQMLPWYDTVYGINSVALRYFNAAGAALDGSAGQDHEPATHIISRAIKAALGQDDRFHLFGEDYPTPDGTCIRDYIHVLDLATAHVVALDYLVACGHGDVFNVGTGLGHSNRDVMQTVKQVSGVDFAVEISPRRAGDPAELVADSARLRELTGWRPACSDLETIVASAWKWHSAHPRGYSGVRQSESSG
jgi:UDP-glucose 4-epimerase